MNKYKIMFDNNKGLTTSFVESFDNIQLAYTWAKNFRLVNTDLIAIRLIEPTK